MRTPAEYTKNLKNKILTGEMLEECLYSVNKRAKNWRDNARYYEKNRRNRYYYSVDNAQVARENEEKYYAMKDKFLSLLKPKCIHKEFQGYERSKIYDYEPNWYEMKHIYKVIREGGYYDKDMKEYVCFAVIEDQESPQYAYYLFYDMGNNHTFHSPIYDPKNYPDLEVVELEDRIITSGDDIDDLLSVQFVKKVLALIESGDYTLKLQNPIVESAA